MAAARVTTYKLKSPSITGSVYVRYRDGLFSALDGSSAELTPAQWAYLLKTVPVQESQWHAAALGAMKVDLLVPRSVKDKVVAFCAAHLNYRQVAYQPKQLEKANLKDVVVTDELLRVFFESPLQNFSLKNYIDRINITRDQARNGRAGTGAFPNRWDAAFAATLTGETLNGYRAHLRALGWKYDPRLQRWVEPVG
jgi:hypothetical protein